MSNQQKLPSFKKPPVVEVVCGVQFQSLPAFSSALFGKYWTIIADEYNETRDMPPLPTVIDRGAQGTRVTEVQFSHNVPLPRVFFVDNSKNRLIQVQENRFHNNWRALDDADIYPRYETVKNEFFQRFKEFKEFCATHNVGEVRPLQFELTYINHLLQGAQWATIMDLKDILPVCNWQAPENGFLPSPDMLAWKADFPVENCNGHLSISTKHGMRRKDSRQLFILELTVRGFPPQKESSMGIEDWFERAHEWIVNGFASITSADAHKYWGRQA